MNEKDKKDLTAFVAFFLFCATVIGGIVYDVTTSPSPVVNVTEEVEYSTTVEVPQRSR